jgi:CheY-like chemotaxis protein
MKTLAKIKLLIVEDNPVTLESLREYMRMHGHETETAGNGLGAEVALLAFKPDAVVVDHIMPGLNGLGFIKRLRAVPLWAQTPVVLITALADGPELNEVTQELASLQPARLLRKPFDPPDLLTTLYEMTRAPGVGDDRVKPGLTVTSVVQIEPVDDGQGHITWRACYREVIAHGMTREEALASLREALALAGIPVPKMPDYREGS